MKKHFSRFTIVLTILISLMVSSAYASEKNPFLNNVNNYHEISVNEMENMYLARESFNVIIYYGEASVFDELKFGTERLLNDYNVKIYGVDTLRSDGEHNNLPSFVFMGREKLKYPVILRVEDGIVRKMSNGELTYKALESTLITNEKKNVSVINDDAVIGINVKTPTKEEIIERSNLIDIDMTKDYSFKYSENPVTKSPYRAGVLTDDCQKNALDLLNLVRFIAGLDDNLSLDDEYIKFAQSASLVNFVNDELTHFPKKPVDMEQELFKIGYEGAGSSNLAMHYPASDFKKNIIHGWMADEDDSNIAVVGHRRWILNPKMSKTGFGAVGHYSSMYSFDHGNKTANYRGVAWPAQNMPLEYFENMYPWSYSAGVELNIDNVKVELTRVKDGKVWTFSKKQSDGFFNVENNNYGQKGCVIFRPDNINYKQGDTFKVKISGDMQAQYFVDFFSIQYYLQNKEKSTTKSSQSDLLKQTTIIETENRPSEWAQAEVSEAILNNLVTEEVRKNYQANITRAEFCSLVMKLYTQLGGKLPEKSVENKFTDTDSLDVIYANALGIVKGTSDTTFAPDDFITREQLATMIKRTLDLIIDTSKPMMIYSKINVSELLESEKKELIAKYGEKLENLFVKAEIPTDFKKYLDFNKISSWAKGSFEYLYKMKALKGFSSTELAPLANTTREQAILISNRVYNAVKLFKASANK